MTQLTQHLAIIIIVMIDLINTITHYKNVHVCDPPPPQPDIAPLPDITKVKVADKKAVEGVSSLILLR